MRASSLLVAAMLCTSAGCHEATATTPPGEPAGDQPVAQDWSVRVWDTRAGREVALPAVLDELATHQYVLVGETHLDAQTHRMERVLLEGLAERKPDRVVLSLEMFERDVQPVLDQYLAGEIDEPAFVAQSRPWGNYRTGYRPMIEAAKARGVPVVAANLPASLRMSFAMKKAAALQELDETQRGWVPETIHPPAEAYWARLQQRLRDHGHGSMQTDDPQARQYSIQNLWDNTMAQACVGARAENPEITVMHVAGAFHVEQGLGIGHQIRQREPQADIVTVTIVPVWDLSRIEPAEDSVQADYHIYVPAQARGPSGGTYAVSVPTELRYHLSAPEQPGPAPLLVWLADDGARIEDALEHWRMVLGEQVMIAAIEPPYPRREDDLRIAGQWTWPETYAEDQQRLVQGIHRMLEYLRTHFEVDERAIVVAGAGSGATTALWIGLLAEDESIQVAAIDPSDLQRFAEASVPDAIDSGQITVIADEETLSQAAEPFAAAGRAPQSVRAANDNLAWFSGQDEVRRALGLPEPPPAQRTTRMAIAVDTPLARQWGRLFAAAHPGVRIELAFGPDAEGDPVEVPPSLFESGEHLPLAPGAFGGTTVLVLPERLPATQRKAWLALGEADVLQKRSRFHHLAVTDAKGLPKRLEELEGKGRRNVLIIPAEFVAAPQRMTALQAAIANAPAALEITWLPGLGAALARATHAAATVPEG